MFIPASLLSSPIEKTAKIEARLSSTAGLHQARLPGYQQPVGTTTPGSTGWQSQEYGLLIVQVDEKSPAQKGGLLLGDILIAIDGHPLKDTEDLRSSLTGDRVGKAIPIEVIRGGALQTLQVTVGQRS